MQKNTILKRHKLAVMLQQYKRAITYLCIAGLIIVGLMSIIATGGGVGAGAAAAAGAVGAGK